MLTEVKDIHTIHIIIYYIDGGEMEREGQKGWRWGGGRCRNGLWLGWGQHTEEWIWRGHGAGMAGEKAINETVKTESLLDNY